MSLNVKYENMKNSHDNVIPLGDSEIKSILKTQSEAVFIEEKKMIPNNSGFIKKTLIDLAIEFENKGAATESEDKNSKVEKTEIIEPSLDTENEGQSLENTREDQTSIEDKASDDPNINNKKIQENENNEIDSNAEELLKSNELDISKVSLDKNIELTEKQDEGISEISIDIPIPVVEETQQALESVRNAVSKSINNSIEENENNNQNNSDINLEKSNDISIEVNQDIDYFKNIFSTLSNLTEKTIHESIENKIIEIASELAGYQIDKMPEKYEKKIKTFLKSINRFEEKMSIETNDKDYLALSKIENFKNINETIKFKPNSDISRGDIILNCDGMHYSEKTIKKK